MAEDERSEEAAELEQNLFESQVQLKHIGQLLGAKGPRSNFKEEGYGIP